MYCQDNFLALPGVTPQLQLEIDPQGRGGLSGENLDLPARSRFGEGRAAHLSDEHWGR